MTAKEPYNYFLLLRALFRSIGGGNHDLLYQEFLPLLPNLLQGNIILKIKLPLLMSVFQVHLLFRTTLNLSKCKFIAKKNY